MLKQTKSFFLFSAIFFTFFISCKKASSNTDIALGTISVSIDGTATTFNYGAKASNIAVTGGYGIKIHGNKKDPSTSATNLTISVVRPTPITTGTYVENAGGNPLVKIDYFFDVFFGSGSTSSSYGSTTNPVNIIITEMSASSVKGTFSGELEGISINGTKVKTVLSNGVFYVSF